MTDRLPDQLPFEFDLDEDEPRERYTGRMRYVTSVSQIKMFSPSAKGCPRKWALHYLAGFPREMTQALRDGIRLHKSIKERWCAVTAPGADGADAAWSAKWQQDPKTRALALALMRHVPTPTDWISEPTYFLEVEELDTAIFIKPDLLRTPLQTAFGHPPDFKDWKSTSALHKRSPWVLQDPAWWPGGQLPEPASSAEKLFSLQNDIQFRLYSHGLMTLFGEREIEGEWIYGCKKFQPADEQPKTWALRARAQRAECKDWCETYVWPIIRTMNALREGFSTGRIDSALLVPHNAFSCEHRGKFCDVLGQCSFKKSPIDLEKLRLPVIPA
jgi:hypothetical protein